MSLKKYFICIFLISMLLLSGCGKKKERIVVWTPPEDIEYVKEAVNTFKAEYKDEGEYEIVVQSESISGVKKLIINNVDNIADVFRYADDQVYDLLNSDALSAVTVDKDLVVEENGGEESAVISAASKDGELYGYPATASNGYFLYYNKQFLSDEDVKTLDGIKKKCAEQGKSMVMDLSSGWYSYSFFGGAGMSVSTNEDNTKNVCDFNRTDGKYTGVDVVNSMLDALSGEGFKHMDNGIMIETIDSDDNIAAIVSGTWHYSELSERWGDNLMATKLPTFTIKGNQEQMKSFAGYSYYGIYKKSQNAELASEFARWITNYDSQLKRYDIAGDCPSNIAAAKSEEISKSVIVSAFAEQSRYSITQNVLEPYWNPMTVFSTFIISGNPDEIDIQTLLDETVDNITQ